jgi:hypothetical protein
MEGNVGMKSIPAISAEADILCKRLSDLSPGQVVTYEELSMVIARDVRTDARGALVTARKKAEGDHGMLLVVVRGIGIKRAMGEDYVGQVASAVKHTRLHAKRQLKRSLRMTKEEYTNLSDEQKTKINVDRTICGTVAHFAGGRIAKKIEEEVKVQNERLSIGKVMELNS